MRGISIKTRGLIEYAYQLLEVDHPQTLRQLHYAIFSRREIDYQNNQADYKRLSRATTLARRAYRAWELEPEPCRPQPNCAIPTDWMIDETRQPEMVSMWRDANEYLEVVRRSYRRDNWQDQDNYVEVWSEKATILASIRPVADKWGIPLRVCHGFGSTGMEGQIGRLFETIRNQITVFYLGDHDPSGHAIESDMYSRVQVASQKHFSMSRLAIHAADIEGFRLPPQTMKVTDSRAASFRSRFGALSATVELDALPASELRSRIERGVSNLIDHERWQRHDTVQEIELTCIAEFADRVKNLPQLSGGAA